MSSFTKDLIFGCEYALLPAGVKAMREKFDRILNSGFLRASCEYRHASRTFLINCSPEHEDGVGRLFKELLKELLHREISQGFASDDEEIDSRLISRVRYDTNNVELPRDFVDKKQEWPSTISDFDFKSIWAYFTKNNAQPRLIPGYRQMALKALTGIELFEDLDSQCIYVGADSQDCLTSALHKLDMLKKQVDSFKHGDSHVFFTEHRENFQVSVRLIPSVKKRLEYTTLLDPVHNSGTTNESYRALNLACTIRCCPFDHMRNTFVLKSGEKLFALVRPEAKQKGFQPWEKYVHTMKGVSSVPQRNGPPPLVDFKEDDVTSVTRQRSDPPPLVDFKEVDVTSIIQQRNNHLPLANFEDDDVIPGLEPSERNQNVANWLLKDLPDVSASTTLHLIHNICHRDQRTAEFAKDVKIGDLKTRNYNLPIADIITPVRPATPQQTRLRVTRNGTQSSSPLGLSPDPDIDLLVPLDEDQGQNLMKLPLDPNFDFFSPLKDEERGNLERLSPERKTRSQSSMTYGIGEDLRQFSTQMPLRLEKGEIQASNGRPKHKLNTSKAPDAFATLLDGPGDDVSVATASALPPWNLESEFRQTIDPRPGIIPPQNKSKPEPQPVQNLAFYKNTKAASNQISTTLTQGKPSSTTVKATFNKSSQPDPTAAVSKTTEYFDKGIAAGMKPITANMRWWQGEVTLEAQLGRILIRGLASHMIDAPEKSSPPEEVSRLLKNTSNSVQFTKLVSTLPADAQFILDMKSDANDQLWGPAVKKSVTYQYDCSVPGSERFIVEMDAESFETRVKSLPSKLGCIYVHGTLRNLDYRVIALGTRNLNSEHGLLAKAIADSTYVEVKRDRVLLWFRLSKDLEVEVDAVRVYHRSHHLSFDGKSVLNIIEVHDLDVDLAKSPKWMTYRAHSPDSITQPVWYEISVSSEAVEGILQENSTVEIGKQATWTEETLNGQGTILSGICLPANLLVKRLDGLGFYNKNPNEPQQLLDDADNAPVKTSSTPQPPIVYW